MDREKSWRERVKLAADYIKLGQKEQYLDRNNAKDYPWEFVTSVEPGGGHRMDMDTSVWFYAPHPSGLVFRWSFEVEFNEADGKGYYMIDTDGCASVMAALSAKGKEMFKKYLKKCAKSVAEQGEKYEQAAKSQREIAAALERLSR